jgi:hypothetical protein
VKTAIMQPYFLPYIGYWQLVNCVDEFVVYDNIEFTKKGWFNRNRILENGRDRLFTLPVKKDSDYLSVNKRYLSDDSDKEIKRTLRIIESNYKKAPYFLKAYPIIEECFLFSDKNLFEYIFSSLKTICNYLDIKTPLIVSSKIPIDHSLKAEKKVMAICKQLKTTTYVNAIGGKELYDKKEFEDNGLDLKFIKSSDVNYKQLNKQFVPWLSIIDVMMFNDRDEIRQILEQYELI